MTESLPIDGRSLALEPFLSVVRGRSTVSLTAEARAEIQASRAVVDAAVRRGRAILRGDHGVRPALRQDRSRPPRRRSFS